MYRGKDDQGEIQGGVMYFIENGLGEKISSSRINVQHFRAFGCITFFQANQLSQIIRDFIYQPLGLFESNTFIGNMFTGMSVSFGFSGDFWWY